VIADRTPSLPPGRRIGITLFNDLSIAAGHQVDESSMMRLVRDDDPMELEEPQAEPIAETPAELPADTEPAIDEELPDGAVDEAPAKSDSPADKIDIDLGLLEALLLATQSP
jgi:hypothetical protein